MAISARMTLANPKNAQAAAPFPLNGREEAEHGGRLQHAAELPIA